MKITEIVTTPLFIPYKTPFHWAHGQITGADVLLVEIRTDTGITGFGECISAPDPIAMKRLVDGAADGFLGASPQGVRRLVSDAYERLFRAQAVCSAPRFAGQVLAGLEMALWDILGKAVGQPVHALLGGAFHDEIGYHGFAMGGDTDAVVAEALALVREGFDVIYLKAGFGIERDIATIRAIRAAAGPDIRLRIDPNESWSALEARQMFQRLAPHDIEFIEQPVRCESIPALAALRATSRIALAADQSVFTPDEAFDVVRQQAADLIVIGPHECGGIARMTDIARIAALGGLNICLHGLYESGITTCASHMAAVACPNADDGNQHMLKFLEWDIVRAPDLMPVAGRLPVLQGPGLGFELDHDRVAEAAALAHARIVGGPGA